MKIQKHHMFTHISQSNDTLHHEPTSCTSRLPCPTRHLFISFKLSCIIRSSTTKSPPPSFIVLVQRSFNDLGITLNLSQLSFTRAARSCFLLHQLYPFSCLVLSNFGLAYEFCPYSFFCFPTHSLLFWPKFDHLHEMLYALPNFSKPHKCKIGTSSLSGHLRNENISN